MKAFDFLIEHGDWRAEIRIPAEYVLEDLAFAIIEAVGFEMDHAYGFYDNLKNPYRSKEEYTLFADMGLDAKEGDKGVETTRVDEVFKPRKKMLFLFDYGDDWMFLVTCKSAEDVRAFKRPKLLDRSGEPPQQYPDYDEEI